MDLLLTLAVLFYSACAPAPSGGRPRSVAELLVIIDAGQLPARRTAIDELRRTAPVTPAELELLASAALQTRRVRVRRAALAALGNARSLNPRLIPGCLRLSEAKDSAVSRAGAVLCLNIGMPFDDPRLAHARRSHPDAFPKDPGKGKDWAEFRVRAERAERALAPIGPAELRAAAEDLERFKRAGDAAGLIALLDTPALRAGGYEAGRLAAAAGAPLLERASQLARSEELLEQDLGLGIVFHMRDPAAIESLRELALGEGEAAACARDALTAMQKKP